jgi:hypothetical protein
MELSIQRRAEVAFRSLHGTEHDAVKRALAKLSMLDRMDLRGDRNFKILATRFSGREIAVYRASNRMRLILAFHEDACIIEDIVDRDRLGRLVIHEVQE